MSELYSWAVVVAMLPLPPMVVGWVTARSGVAAFVTVIVCTSLSVVVVPLPDFLTWMPLSVVTPEEMVTLVSVISFHVVPSSRLYFMPLSTFVSVPLSVPVAVKVALGVGSFSFAVGAVSVIVTSAVGVPETVICVKLSRVTLTPLTASTL